MIGSRSNSNWSPKLFAYALIFLSGGIAHGESTLNWVVADTPAATKLPELEVAFPASDWVTLDSVEVVESIAELWPESTIPEIYEFEPAPASDITAINADGIAFPEGDWIEVAQADVIADDDEDSPWVEADYLGPTALIQDVEETTVQPTAEQEQEQEQEQAEQEASKSEVLQEAWETESGPQFNPLLDEEFLVGEQVLEDAANTEYLKDLGLDDATAELSYNELAEDIAQEGLAMLDDSSEAATNGPPRYNYNSEFEAEADSLTLNDILELALSNNPQLGAALAREEQARWAFREAQVYKYPTVDLVLKGGPEFNRPATNSSEVGDITPGRSATFRVTQLLYDGGVSVNESDRRLQVRRSTELETRLLVEEIVVDAVEFYTQVLQHQRAAAVAEEFVEEMQRIVDKLQVMYDSGAASKLELDFAKARLASARAETGNTTAQLNDALSNLEFLTGDLPEFTAVPPKDIHDLYVDNLHDYIDIARKQNASVLLNISNKNALRYKIRSQRSQFAPVFSLNFRSESLADQGGNSPARNTTEVKLKAEYFIYDGGARKARLNRTRAQLSELEFEDERLYKEVDRVVKQAYNQITTNQLTLDATEDEIASNQELRRLNRQNLEMGEISIIELIEAEERLFNSQATWYRVSSEMFKNYFELMVNAGELAKLVGPQHTQTRIEDKKVAPELD